MKKALRGLQLLCNAALVVLYALLTIVLLRELFSPSSEPFENV